MRNCQDCGIEFDARPTGRGVAMKRCPVCRAAHRIAQNRAISSANRARKTGSGRVEVVMHLDVFERDNWICYLCGEAVPEESRGNTGTHTGDYDPLAPSLEHVVPRSQGGDHTLENLRTAHQRCNRLKFTNSALPDATTRSAVSLPGAEPCNVDGCPRTAGSYRHGRCNTHHHRFITTGDPLKAFCGCGCKQLIAVEPEQRGKIMLPGHRSGSKRAETMEEQLQTRFRVQSVSDHGRRVGLTDDCHIWIGSMLDGGYGVVSYRVDFGKRKATPAHRAVYAIAYGEAAVKGLVVDHLCRVRACINVNHLEAVTHAENLNRSAGFKTHCPNGHEYTSENLVPNSRTTICKQCARNATHIPNKGHEFVIDPSNPSTKRQRCLVCHQQRGAKPAA